MIKPDKRDEIFVRFPLTCSSASIATQSLAFDHKLVNSFSDFQTQYLVSLREQVCTCPDFAERREQPLNHFSRWCKHLICCLNKANAFEKSSAWHRAIVCSGYGGPIDAFLVATARNQQFLLTVGLNSHWVNVFGKKARPGERSSEASGRIVQFGWSISEKRWSYGAGPPGARDLRPIMKKIEGIKRS